MGSNQWYSNSNGWYHASSPQDQVSSPTEYFSGYYQSQPMARDMSSGAALRLLLFPSHLYSTTIMLCYEQQFSSGQAMAEESIIPRSETGNDWPVQCLHPGCPARPFKRTADLLRHYKNTHAPESSKDVYLCDYPRCGRSRDPFHRRDHFRDHLREYHREDIQKRGATVNEEWLEGRYAPAAWWRCQRCLVRVYVSKNGFECPGCKTSCESKRKEKRRSRS
ncbi:hypothetical protein FCULG_00009342 [Fusarium culmorum]|uniref:C2H2-type domain-containing protein n=1 Tax=Fusarium culmorum TaxID=5516 RepID=A0A2T4GIQ7_FUSCU|nr:hypothetical protein FCULG_00009342 [Fusarium culmorum]